MARGASRIWVVLWRLGGCQAVAWMPVRARWCVVSKRAIVSLHREIDWCLEQHPDARLVGITARGTAWVDYGGTDESWRALAHTFQAQEL